jgi:hypothetical protein
VQAPDDAFGDDVPRNGETRFILSCSSRYFYSFYLKNITTINDCCNSVFVATDIKRTVVTVFVATVKKMTVVTLFVATVKNDCCNSFFFATVKK